MVTLELASESERTRQSVLKIKCNLRALITSEDVSRTRPHRLPRIKCPFTTVHLPSFGHRCSVPFNSLCHSRHRQSCRESPSSFLRPCRNSLKPSSSSGQRDPTFIYQALFQLKQQIFQNWNIHSRFRTSTIGKNRMTSLPSRTYHELVRRAFSLDGSAGRISLPYDLRPPRPVPKRSFL